MKKALIASLALMLLTTPATQAATKQGDHYTVTVYITGAQHLEEVFATLSIGRGPVSDRVSSQTLRHFEFFVVEGYSADFTFWGDKCRSCKIKRHFDASQRVPKKLTIALR